MESFVVGWVEGGGIMLISVWDVLRCEMVDVYGCSLFY